MLRHEVIPATFDHAVSIGERMRDQDRAEVWASHRLTPKQAAVISVTSCPQPLCWLADGVPAAIIGCNPAPLLGRGGSPWLLGTDLVVPHAVPFLRFGRGYLDAMLDAFGYLENFVYCENRISVRWLKWLGFSFSDPTPHGPGGELFYRFSMEK